MPLAPLLVVLLTVVGPPPVGQEEAAAPWQAACVDYQRRVVATRIPPSEETSTQKLAVPEVSHCWVWSDTCAPRKVLIGEALPAECEGRAVRVQVRQAPEPTSARVRVAPLAMWAEVPESLLPESVTDKEGRAEVVVGKERSKLRAIGSRGASEWRSLGVEEGAVELELLPTRRFDWKILAQGEALTDARLYLLVPSESERSQAELLALEQADEKGEIHFLLPEKARSAVLVSSNDRLPRVFRRLQDVPDVVALDRGIVVSGLLVDDLDQPVPGVLVAAQGFIPGGFGAIKRSQMMTGTNGRFALSGIPPGTVLLHAKKGERVLRQQLDARLDRPVIALGRVQLSAIATVAVSVADAESGTLIANSWAVREDGEGYRPGEDGLLHLRIEGAELMFFFDAEGYLPERHSIVAPVAPEKAGPRDPVLVLLKPALEIRGSYVKEDGFTPVTGGRARIAGAGRTQFEELAPDGTFLLEVLAGSHSLELTADNAGRRRLQVEGLGGEVRDLGVIVAPQSPRISGQVATPDGRPVVGARLIYTRPSELGEVLAWAFGDTASTQTDDLGFFVLEGVEPAPARLRIEAQGWVVREVAVEPVAGEDLDLGILELSAGHVLVVRSEEEAATVTLDPGLRNLPQDLLLATITEGEAEFTAVPSGLLRVRVLTDGHPVCEKEVEISEDTQLTCSRNAVRLRGRVTVAGQPAAGMLVLQQERQERLPEAVFRQGLGAQERTRVLSTSPEELTAVLDGDGLYTFASVLPGRWEVIWMRVDQGVEQAEPFLVPDAAATEVVHDFDFAGVSIRGSVVNEAGDLVENVTVDLYPGPETQQADGAGRFGFRGLLPGEYQLRARREGTYSELVSVDLRARDTVEGVVLVLGSGVRDTELRAQILGASAGLCFFETDDGSKRVVMIHDALARLELRPPVARSFRVACLADGRWGFAGWRGIDKDDPYTAADIDVGEATASLRFTAPRGQGGAIELSYLGWDLGQLRQWFGGAARFGVDEVVHNLPAGQYLARVAGREIRVRARARRTVEIELPPAEP